MLQTKVSLPLPVAPEDGTFRSLLVLKYWNDSCRTCFWELTAMIKMTGCCLSRFLLVGIVFAVIIGIVMYVYVIPAVRHEEDKLGHEYRAAKKQLEHGAKNHGIE